MEQRETHWKSDEKHFWEDVQVEDTNGRSFMLKIFILHS